jgi:hypothetical protein
MADSLMAGAARSDITPPPGSLLVGYADPNRLAESVRDPLNATAVVLKRDETCRSPASRSPRSCCESVTRARSITHWSQASVMDATASFVTRESRARGGYEVWVARAYAAQIPAEHVDDALVESNSRLLKQLAQAAGPPAGAGGCLNNRRLPPAARRSST